MQFPVIGKLSLRPDQSGRSVAYDALRRVFLTQDAERPELHSAAERTERL